MSSTIEHRSELFADPELETGIRIPLDTEIAGAVAIQGVIEPTHLMSLTDRISEIIEIHKNDKTKQCGKVIACAWNLDEGAVQVVRFAIVDTLRGRSIQDLEENPYVDGDKRHWSGHMGSLRVVMNEIPGQIFFDDNSTEEGTTWSLSRKGL